MSTNQSRLRDAATALARAAHEFANALSPSASSLSGDLPTMRFGRAKGIPLSQADDADVEWYVDALAKSIADPSKSQYADANRRELALARAEQARRLAAPGEMPGRPLAADDEQIPF